MKKAFLRILMIDKSFRKNQKIKSALLDSGPIWNWIVLPQTV